MVFHTVRFLRAIYHILILGEGPPAARVGRGHWHR
jgi:hypothetical protein